MQQSPQKLPIINLVLNIGTKVAANKAPVMLPIPHSANKSK
ncbi:hypothetical protein J656_0966 [Acinetobacter baumannii 755829]|nr:hypothetical protein J656_0966 [Acinetobacter baumannii 755829]